VTSEQETAVYRLLRVPGLGPGAIERILTAWKDSPDLAESFWGRPIEEYRSRWGLSARAARLLRDEDRSDDDWRAGEADAAAARTAHIELIAILDSGYAALAATRDLPSVLFTRGNQDLLWNAGAAIAHSRGASEDALEWGAQLAAALAEAGVGLITGHNRDGYRRTAAAAKRLGAP